MSKAPADSGQGWEGQAPSSGTQLTFCVSSRLNRGLRGCPGQARPLIGPAGPRKGLGELGHCPWGVSRAWPGNRAGYTEETGVAGAVME